jgi:hypothetical protein
MAVALFIAAVVFAFTDNWWLTPFLAVAAIAVAADTIERQRRATDCRVSQLRRRQLDDLHHLDPISDRPNPPGHVG